MTPIKFKLECEACGFGFVVTYDADVPTAILQLDCKCGHSTPVKKVPTTLATFNWRDPVIEGALQKLGSSHNTELPQTHTDPAD